MKKKLITTAMSVLFLISFVFAANANDPDPVTVYNFNKIFSNAKESTWEVISDLNKVSFYNDNQYMVAFFSNDGNLLNISKNISTDALPIILKTQLENKRSDSWITELFEIDDQAGTSYYATVENASKKIIYKSNSSNWYTYRVQNK